VLPQGFAMQVVHHGNRVDPNGHAVAHVQRGTHQITGVQHATVRQGQRKARAIGAQRRASGACASTGRTAPTMATKPAVH
jgi:hypothetical protein